MPEEAHDNWLRVLGIDVNEIRTKLQGVVSDVQTKVDQGIDNVAHGATELYQDAENAVTPTVQKPESAGGGEAVKAGTSVTDDSAASGPADLTAPFSISASVGRKGKNQHDDVEAVQAALNRRNNAGLDVDGKVGPRTIGAIEAFQRKIGGFPPDGLVEPNRATARALRDGLPAQPKKPNGDGPSPGGLAYEPGEREASQSSPGRVEKTASGLVLFDFPVGSKFLKPEHRKALTDLVASLKLDDPNGENHITVISGFTDAVDTEPKNSTLREDRADAVQIFLMGQGADEGNVGVIGKTGSGTFLATNKTREGRARNRAVTINLGALKIDPIPIDPPTPTSTKSKKWALQSNLSASVPTKPGVAISTVNFILHDRDHGKKHLLQFTGFGGGFGLSFPASVSLPAPTDFETTTPVDVADFNGGGAIRSAAAGVVIGFSVGDATLHPATTPPQIDIGGFQFSFGVEASFIGGEWKVLD
jgi:outer membrane protein OmpA-like peptidoglycan-associated protein